MIWFSMKIKKNGIFIRKSDINYIISLILFIELQFHNLKLEIKYENWISVFIVI